MIPPSWVDSARKEILALPEGETLDLIKRFTAKR